MARYIEEKNLKNIPTFEERSQFRNEKVFIRVILFEKHKKVTDEDYKARLKRRLNRMGYIQNRNI